VETAREEAKRTDGVDAVAIVTPNYLHHAPAKVFLEARIPGDGGATAALSGSVAETTDHSLDTSLYNFTDPAATALR
jgi:hypothetical protein